MGRAWRVAGSGMIDGVSHLHPYGLKVGHSAGEPSTSLGVMIAVLVRRGKVMETRV